MVKKIIMNKKNIIILIIILILAGVAYGFFFGGKKDTGVLGTEGTPVTTSNESVIDETVGQEFVTLLLKLNDIKLDNKIFGSIAFLKLQDFTKALTSLNNEGRINPFAPVGAEEEAVIIENIESGTIDDNTATDFEVQVSD